MSANLIRNELIQREGVHKRATRRGMNVYLAGSPSETLFFVDSGFVRLMRRASDKAALISIIGPGQLFGEQALYGQDSRISSAEVLQDGFVYEFPRSLFVQFCESHPEMWRYLSELLARRTRELEEKVARVCLHTVELRILEYLNSLSNTFEVAVSDSEPYSLPLSQTELAQIVGAARETVSTTLNVLARNGLVKLDHRSITVSSAAAVRAAVEDYAPKTISAHP
jgi:CRP/FNR family transcriptional regulator